ncbi:MAG: DEAD/DEAH box helicase, partial [Synergistales bacterium]|nr:DEAD/DEAH box helicase [Synergistales bacterium]
MNVDFPVPQNDLFKVDTKDWLRGMTLSCAVDGSAWSWIARSFPKQEDHTVAILPNLKQCSEFVGDLRTLTGKDCLMLHELPLVEEKSGDRSLWIQRGECVKEWIDTGGMLAATPGGILGPLQESHRSIALSAGSVYPRDALLQWLTGNGYHAASLVWEPGQFAARGSIVDLFDPVCKHPLRIEYYDDEIENLRLYDTESQLTHTPLQEIELHALEASSRAAPLSLLDYIPDTARFLFYDPQRLENNGESYYWLWENLRANNPQLPELLQWQELLLRSAAYPRCRIAKQANPAPDTPSLRLSSIPVFKGHWQEIRAQVTQWKQQGLSVVVYSRSEETCIWARERALESRQKPLTKGFLDQETEQVFLSDTELIGVTLQEADERFWFAPPQEWGQHLTRGSWVVHEEYGVARFLGTEMIEGPLGEQEYLVLEYAGKRRLLAPITQLYRISSYESPSGEAPTPDNLKGSRWKKTYQKAREKAKQEAKVIAKIFAQRETTQGYRFPESDQIFAHVEHNFPYSETRDQLRAIRDIEQDMEHPSPMDRLIVGDVGFGKTEVALRAAVKAAEAGKQTVFLVPTTILAQQHYETFTQRLSGVPLRVSVLSRFVSTRDQEGVLQELREGTVDILIGTHRLLQRDLCFHDLGLLIVDEEHHFGVMHKESLKERYATVDVLTLSATPIPRTLHLALGGFRDITVINTPPQHRYPVITLVSPWRDDLVQTAVRREIARGGQIYFVHNRIHDIDRQARMLHLMVPEAGIASVHGRMNERELAQRMREFADGAIDVLVSTTIIESGLDMPRANTLIVDNAHHMGLAQLHQLRGRVGRRSEQAFALLLYPEAGSLSPDAAERLDAIAELYGFGSGYDIARRDLEIRGGGDLVGVSQHGHGERVGFALYCKMLEEELKELNQDDSHKRCEMEITLRSGIPAWYIPQENVRIALYRRL